MTRLSFFFSAVLALCMAATASAQDDRCDPDYIASLKKQSFTTKQIWEFCYPEKAAARVEEEDEGKGHICQTEFGSCDLSHLGTAPIGSGCYCINRHNGSRVPGRIIK